MIQKIAEMAWSETDCSFIKQRLRNCEASEISHTLLRFFIGAIWLLCLVWLPSGSTATATNICCIYIGFCLLHLLWIITQPEIPTLQRMLAILLDVGLASYALYLLGEYGILLFWIYLFISFRYGFRYGNRYLLISAMASVLSVLLLIQYSVF